MPKTAKRTVTLLLMLALLTMGLPAMSASANVTKLIYQVHYSSEDLSTPTDWYNSSYFNDPAYKENRFVQYWVETPITPGGPRDTGFYMVYNEEGLNIFFQSNETERDANNVLKNSSIEMFLQTGRGDMPYHQMIIQTNGSPYEYYEWQTEYRHNRPLQGNSTVINEEIPTGWGTVVSIPWETFYEYVPLNGEDWEFMMIRWSPSNSPTWGGKVHQTGRFNVLDFQAPTAAQRTAIQKNVILAAWDKFNDTVTELNAAWLNGDADDQYFYNQRLQPLISAGQANGSQIPNIDNLSAVQIDALYRHVPQWFELRYDAEDARIAFLKNRFLLNSEDPGTLQPPSGLTAAGQPSGVGLTWSASTSPDVVGYNVYENGTKVNATPVAGLSYSVSDLTYGTAYDFEVEAVNGDGEASARAAVSGTPSHYLIELDRWGIHNDGTQGVSTANGLNQAIQWAQSQLITAMYLPEGTYSIPAASRVRILSNTLFEMDPDAVVRKETNGSQTYQVFYVSSADDNVTLKGGQIAGDRYTHDYTQAGTHENGYGILIEGADNTVVDNVYAHDFIGGAIHVRAAATNTVIRNSELASNRAIGVNVNGAAGILIENNEIHGTDGVGLKAGINVHTANGAANTGVTIRGNTLSGNGQYDVRLDGGNGALVEDNTLGSSGAYGLFRSTAYNGSVVAQNNTFNGSKLYVYKDIQLNDNTMSGGQVRLEGSGVVVDGLDATDTPILMVNNVTDGILISNLNLDITRSDLDTSLNIWGSAGTHFSNVTISGKPSLRSLGGGNTGYHYFDNLQVVGYHPSYGINLLNGEYTNSRFEVGAGGKGGVGLTSGGKYVFDNTTVVMNADGGGGIFGSNANLDLTVTNSNFSASGAGSAISVQQNLHAVIEGNVFTATGVPANMPIVYIGYYWNRTLPAKVFDVTIHDNEITSDTAGTIGISTEYAGVGADPFTVTDNTLTKAVLRLKTNDMATGNVVTP